MWATRNACLKIGEIGRDKYNQLCAQYGIRCEQLDTTNTEGEVVQEILDGYTYIFKATKPLSYSKFLEFFKRVGNPVYPSKKKNEKEVVPSYTTQPTSKKNDKQYLVVTPIEQYMIATGKRMFKGYEDYDDCLRMIFDLETTGLDTKKDRIEQFGIRFNRPVKYHGEEMTFEKVYSTEGNSEEEKNASELENIERFLKIIYTFRPDIITAYNGEAFDFNILIGACERLGTSFEEMSKKYFDGVGIVKNYRETILKLGGEIETFHQTIIPQTIVTDSLHAVRRAQALDSNMLFSNLKYVTKYSKIVKPDRVYVPGDRISEIWNDNEAHYAFNQTDGDWYIYDPNYIPNIIKADPLKDLNYFQRQIDYDYDIRSVSGGTHCKYNPDVTAEELYNAYLESINKTNEENRLRKGKEGDTFKLYTKNEILEGYSLVTGRYVVQRYLLDDLWECDKVEQRYNTSNFLICKMLPVPFQKCCTMGTAGQWKSLMLAWSYENNLAIPPFGENKTFTGGLSRLLKVGFVPDVAKFDYNSLYPSIILTWGISDAKDLMHTMLFFLEHVLTQREKYKKLKKEAGKAADKYKEMLKNHEYSTKEEGKELNKKMMKAKTEAAANDKKQLPLKILGNSFFGSYGAPNVFPFGSIDCAERTTCTGRQCLRLMIYYFSTMGTVNGLGEDYNYSPIVGDSFLGDTPLFVKYNYSGLINIVPISELIDEKQIQIDEFGREYDYSPKSYKVLCRSGWVEPSYIYRHKTDKDIYEVADDKTLVEVTEDHSLFDSDKNKIKPSEINENTKLEYYKNDIEGDCIIPNLSDNEIEEIAEKVAYGLIDRIPMEILNSDKNIMKIFYDTFMRQQMEQMIYTKTCLAGLQYIRMCILLKD